MLFSLTEVKTGKRKQLDLKSAPNHKVICDFILEESVRLLKMENALSWFR